MMHSRRLLGALTTLAALAGAGLATLPAEAAAPPTRTVEVAYGDGPVTQTSWDEPINLVFRGEKGDRVSVVSSLRPDYCDTGEDLVLYGPDGEVPQPESLFYRLPASGSYTFSYRQDCWDATNDEHNPTLRHSAELQLAKLRMKNATVGKEVSIPFQTGYVAAVRIALQRHQRPIEIPALEWDDGEDLSPYLHAFGAIDVDPGQLLVVAETASPIGAVVATMQLTFIPGLSRRGAWRAQVEAVRVHADVQGRGLGRAMLVWATEEARRRGCSMVQLTSDKQRTDAHRFYAAIGFEASHEGFKMRL